MLECWKKRKQELKAKTQTQLEETNRLEAEVQWQEQPPAMTTALTQGAADLSRLQGWRSHPQRSRCMGQEQPPPVAQVHEEGHEPPVPGANAEKQQAPPKAPAFTVVIMQLCV